MTAFFAVLFGLIFVLFIAMVIVWYIVFTIRAATWALKACDDLRRKRTP